MAVARIRPWSGMSHPVTVSLRAKLAMEANRTAATTIPPKKSPSRRTDSGVARTIVPDSRRVACETASLRKRSVIGLLPPVGTADLTRSEGL